MKILVWKSYGEIGVFSADTTEDVEKIIENVFDIFKSWGDTGSVEKLNTLICKVNTYSKNEVDSVKARRLRNNLFNFLQGMNLTSAYDVEDFEYFYFQEVKQIE